MRTPVFASGTQEVDAESWGWRGLPVEQSHGALVRAGEVHAVSANARCLDRQRASRCDHDMVGITNSAPARMPVGQRLVIVFNRV